MVFGEHTSDIPFWHFRCNTSLLIDFHDDDGQRKFIQIDAGKNFKEQVLRWFVAYQIPRLDAVRFFTLHGQE